MPRKPRARREARRQPSERILPEHKRLNDIRLFTLPRAGTDNLRFMVTETIDVPQLGTDTFNLIGSFRVRRENPTHPEWGRGTIDVVMQNLDVRGESKAFGPVKARLNPEETTRGKVEAAEVVFPGSMPLPSKCLFGAFVHIDVDRLGLTLFNKEAVPLVHRITHVPPIGQGGGTAGSVAINFYNVREPESPPIAILREVRTQIGDFVKRA